MRNHSLTVLRAAASMVVFVSHAANADLLPELFGGGFGQIGVMLFFALCGYLMTELYIERPFDRRNLRAYAAARIGRVVPLYLVVVLASILLTWVTAGEWHYRIGDPQTALSALFFLKAPLELWSVPVEMQFYLLFVAVWAIESKERVLAVRLALPLALIGGAAIGVLLLRSSGVLAFWLPFHLHLFLLGALIALFRHTRLARTLTGGRNNDWLAGICLVALCLNLPFLRGELGLALGGFILNTWFDPLNILVVTGLVLAATNPDNRVFRLFQFKLFGKQPVMHFSDVSFGFYLFHVPILHMTIASGLVATLGTAGALAFAFAATWALAGLSLDKFERPVLEWFRRQGRKSGPDTPSLPPFRWKSVR